MTKSTSMIMKRLLLALVIALIPCVALAQVSNKGIKVPSFFTDLSSARKFERDFKRVLPYHDVKHHFTVTKVGINTQYRYATMTLVMDQGYKFSLEKTPYLQFLVSNTHWDVRDLTHLLFDVRMTVHSSEVDIKDKTKGQGNCSVTITLDDMRQALADPEYVAGSQYLADYCRWAKRSLPITTGEGERCIDFNYDRNKSLTTITFDYEDSIWSDIKQYILDNYDRIREIRALNYLMDTTNQLVNCAQIAGVTIRHLYCSRSRTDSLEINIAPWMWPHYAQLLDQQKQESASQLLYRQFNQLSLPLVVDSVTTLVAASYDTVNHLLTQLYEVPELVIFQMEKNTARYRQALFLSLANEDFLEMLPLLIETRSSLTYAYRSRRSAAPIEFTYSPEELELLAK